MLRAKPPSRKQQTLAVPLRQSTVVSRPHANEHDRRISPEQTQVHYSLPHDRFQSQVPQKSTSAESEDSSQLKSIKNTLMQLFPQDFYSLIYGSGVVVGMYLYWHSKDIVLLSTFLTMTSGQKVLPEVTHFVPWNSFRQPPQG